MIRQKEAVDLYMMNHVKAGGLVITQDIQLCCLKMFMYITLRGISFEEKSIHTALNMRYLSAKAEEMEIFGKGPKPFTNEDRIRFINEYRSCLVKLIFLYEYLIK